MVLVVHCQCGMTYRAEEQRIGRTMMCECGRTVKIGAPNPPADRLPQARLRRATASIALPSALNNGANRRRMLMLVAVISIAVLAIGVWYAIARHKETVAQRDIVNNLKGLIGSCRTDAAITRAGTVLVWDVQKDSVSEVQNMLPVALQAKSTDSPITVFMVTGQRNERVGTYTISGQPAYREYVDIAVARWPARTPVGFYSVLSKDPPSLRQVENSPEYGDLNVPVANWIKTLPKAAQ